MEINRLARPQTGNTANILVVDDSPVTCLITEQILVKRGHSVTTAGRGDEALDRLSHEEYDVVILDLGLPDMDGIEVCQRIRRFSNVFIVMLTGRRREWDRVYGLLQGADDYVVKPFLPLELAARVEVLIRRSQSTSDGAASDASQFFLDSSRRVLLVEGREIQLTKIEFMMLDLLAADAPEIVTRDRLAKHCWGPTSGDGHLINVHMANLRRKIDARCVLIVTVRGIGYHLTSSINRS